MERVQWVYWGLTREFHNWAKSDFMGVSWISWGVFRTGLVVELGIKFPVISRGNATKWDSPLS